MSEITELEQRMKDALARIAQGIDTIATAVPMAPAPVEPDADAPANSGEADQLREQVATLTAQLEEERASVAALDDRVRRIKRRQNGYLNTLDAEFTKHKESYAELENALRRQGAKVDEVIAASESLRSASAEGIADADAINKALIAEIAALKASQAADRAEAATIISSLRVMLARQGEDVDVSDVADTEGDDSDA